MEYEKWSATWKIFGYELGWYGEKLYYFIPIHLILGAIVSIPIWAILTLSGSWHILGYYGIAIRIILFIQPLILGGAIEWTQNDKTGKQWIYRKKWLLGSVRDVLTYLGIAWVVFI